jgi:hypothetical protein
MKQLETEEEEGLPPPEVDGTANLLVDEEACHGKGSKEGSGLGFGSDQKFPLSHFSYNLTPSHCSQELGAGFLPLARDKSASVETVVPSNARSKLL